MKKFIGILIPLQLTTFAVKAEEGHQNVEESALSSTQRANSYAEAGINTPRKFSDNEIRRGGIELAELLKDPQRIDQMKAFVHSEPFKNALKTQEDPSITISLAAGSGATEALMALEMSNWFLADEKRTFGLSSSIGSAGGSAIAAALPLYNEKIIEPGKERTKILDSMEATQLEHSVRSYFYLWGPSAGMNAERREAASQRVISLLELSRGKVLTSSRLQDIFDRALEKDEKNKLLQAQEKFLEIFPKPQQESWEENGSDERARKAAMFFLLQRLRNP